MLPSREILVTLFQSALAEDIGTGDVTSAVTIPVGTQSTAYFVAREGMTVCGFALLPTLLEVADAVSMVQLICHVPDGTTVAAGARIATVSGDARMILALERTALNLVQYLSGIATLTAQFVAAVAGTKAKILDTRKTLPGYRTLAKYAVQCGGGVNHRMGLFDAVLIKDNHIAMAGGLENAVRAALDDVPEGIPIQVEVDTLQQLEQVLKLGIGRVLLDNMPPEVLRQAVAMNAGRALLEASGGVNLQTVRAIAETGVDFISVGAVTHSARAVDIGLDDH